MNRPYISLHIINNNGKTVNRIGSRKSRRIYHFIQRDKYLNCVFELSITYPIHGLTNAGTYKTKNKLLQALRAFLED